jgi:type II secretory pathway pseudopilin PulG
MDQARTSTTRRRRRAGYTLTEIIGAIAVAGTVTGLIIAGYGEAMESAALVRESSAARSAVTALEAYAADNDGRLLPGNRPSNSVRGPDGRRLFGPAAERWYWKLMPYLDYNSEALYVNEPATYYEEIMAKGGDPTYPLSLYPSIGYNGLNVGGDYKNARTSPESGLLGPDAVVTRMGQAHDPDRLIAFISAWEEAPTESDADYVGFWMVRPPRTLQSSWDPGEKPEATGHVHARYDDGAVVAFLQGNVEVLDIEELKDMRLWSNPAAKAGNPDYEPTLPGRRR